MRTKPNIDDVRHRWGEVVATASSHPPTRPVIVEAQVVAVDSECLVLGFPSTKPWLVEAAARRAGVIESALARTFGCTWSVRSVCLSPEQSEPKPSASGPAQAVVGGSVTSHQDDQVPRPEHSGVHEAVFKEPTEGTNEVRKLTRQIREEQARRETALLEDFHARIRAKEEERVAREAPAQAEARARAKARAQAEAKARAEARARREAAQRGRSPEATRERAQEGLEQQRVQQAAALEYLHARADEAARPIGRAGFPPLDDWREQE